MDFPAGIAAMVLAILQQTDYSQRLGLITLNSLSVLAAQDQAVQEAAALAAYTAYLDTALEANANLTTTVETSLLNVTASRRVLPVSQPASSVLVVRKWPSSADADKQPQDRTQLLR